MGKVFYRGPSGLNDFCGQSNQGDALSQGLAALLALQQRCLFHLGGYIVRGAAG